MPRLRRVPLVLAACAALATPAAGATLTGRVDVTVADIPARDGAAAHSRTRSTLATAAGRVDLRPADAAASAELAAAAGTRARIETRADGAVVSADPVASVRAAAAPRGANLLAIVVRPAGETQNVTVPALTGKLFTDSGSVANYFASQAPDGFSLTGKVVGPYDVPAQTTCDDDTFPDAILAQARAAAAAAGEPGTGYDHTMVVFPDQGGLCAWAGLGSVKGPYTWVNGNAERNVLAHELGHNLGLRHANALHCGTGTFVSAQGCTVEEYGDVFSTMGWGSGTTTPGPGFTAQEREELGWLPAPAFAGAATTATLEPVGITGATRRVVFPISSTLTASVEYRPATGAFDSEMSGYGGTGVVAYVQRDGLPYAQKGNFIVDAHPGTQSIEDASLAQGTPVSLGASGATVTLTSVSPFGAQVQITPLADGSAPTAPAGVSAQATGRDGGYVTWQASTDDNRVVDYLVYDNGALAATSNGTNAGLSGLTPGTHQITVVARDQNRNRSAASAPATLVSQVAPRFTGAVAARRSGKDVVITVPSVDDAAGLQSLVVQRNGAELDLMSATTAGGTYTDHGWTGAATYTVVATSRSGLSATSAPVSVAALVAPRTSPAPAPAAAALSGRLRMRCTVRGCTLTADRGTARVASIRVRVGGRTLGVRNGRLSVRVPRRAMGRLRVVRVTALTGAGVALRTYTVRLPAPRRLGDVVSGPLR